MELEAKLYLNGFPKSGTHAIESLGGQLFPRLTKANWLGNVEDNAFSTSLANEHIIPWLDEFLPGRFCKGHMAYTPEIAEAFQRNKICKVFIFRDFRDVAVSAAFHALHPKRLFPKKEYYRDLKFDDMLKRIITGDGTIAGVMERWEMFAPWLDEDWVLKIAYEDFVEHQQGVAGLFLRYVYGKAAAYEGLRIALDPKDYDRELSRLETVMGHPEKSTTYRNGTAGDWKNYFTDEHKTLFKASDEHNWLIKLGYENDRDW